MLFEGFEPATPPTQQHADMCHDDAIMEIGKEIKSLGNRERGRYTQTERAKRL